MTVFARGYRRYEGGFSSRPAWLTIFQEGFRNASRSKGFKILAIILLVIYVVHVAVLFVMLNVNEVIEDTWGRGEAFDFAAKSAELLAHFYGSFFGFASLVATIVVILSGAGLVADDVRTRGLALYLVRPLRAIDYVIGKALILPALLAIIMLVPGLLLWLFAGLWQPGGTSAAWLWDHSIFGLSALRYYVAAVSGYTGVMLILSSFSQRRGWIRVFAVAIFFGSGIVVGLSMLIRGTGGAVLRYLSVGDNAGASLTDLRLEYIGMDQIPSELLENLPDPNIGLAVNLGVLLAGMYCAWRRARSVEVSA